MGRPGERGPGPGLVAGWRALSWLVRIQVLVICCGALSLILLQVQFLRSSGEKEPLAGIALLALAPPLALTGVARDRKSFVSVAAILLVIGFMMPFWIWAALD